MSYLTHAEGKRLAILRKVDRNAVNAGRASWTFARPFDQAAEDRDLERRAGEFEAAGRLECAGVC